jgi:hypothetical protein
MQSEGIEFTVSGSLNLKPWLNTYVTKSMDPSSPDTFSGAVSRWQVWYLCPHALSTEFSIILNPLNDSILWRTRLCESFKLFGRPNFFLDYLS